MTLPPGPPPPAAIAEMFGAAVRHHQAGRLQEAGALYRQILALDRAHVGSLHYLGVLAQQSGRSDEASELIGRAIALDPKIPDCHYNMGLVQGARGRLDDAARHFGRAIALRPDYAEAHMDLGTVRKRQGKSDEALACYRRARELRPDAAQIHYNLANLLAERGELAAAVASYQTAARLAPAVATIRNNLGTALLAQGNFIGAIAEFHEALRRDRNLAEAAKNIGDLIGRITALIKSSGSATAKTMFVRCAGQLAIVPDGLDLRAVLVEALSEPWGRPSDLLDPCKAVLRQNPAIRAAIARVEARWPTRLPAAELIAPSERAAIAGDAFFQCLLTSTRLADMPLERFLTNLRAAMLDDATSATHAAADDGMLALRCAVARQCFLNDYVYDCPPAEAARADGLRARLAAALHAGADIPAASLVACAAYAPLHALPGGDALAARAWPKPVAELLTQQIAEPAEEARLRETIARLTPIDDEVSAKVRRQYEENPYPRWVRLPRLEAPTTLDEHIAARLPLAPLRKSGKRGGSEMLIAGCGTGQQPLEIAHIIAGARVIAVDLSLASLGYAKRKARELGIANIEFAQADILKLGALGRSFDGIEAMGVLHHLADPSAGWDVLIALLKPGGVMRVGLYSEIARRDITAGRELLAAQGFRPTADDIRRCRQHLMSAAADKRLHFVTDSWDFYSVSECRDLLFHVQEHRLSLPAIKDYVGKRGLTFLGFEVAEATERRYAARFPHDVTQTDLDCWHTFETENPRTFLGMYQFWVQKA